MAPRTRATSAKKKKKQKKRTAKKKARKRRAPLPPPTDEKLTVRRQLYFSPSFALRFERAKEAARRELTRTHGPALAQAYSDNKLITGLIANWMEEAGF
jgi:hypothetical protein